MSDLRPAVFKLAFLFYTSLHGLSYISLKLLLSDIALVKIGTRCYTLHDHYWPSTPPLKSVSLPRAVTRVGEASRTLGISSSPFSYFWCAAGTSGVVSLSTYSLVIAAYDERWEAKVRVPLQVWGASLPRGGRWWGGSKWGRLYYKERS